VTESERAYWSILAQIMPVLALALVLELRSVVQYVQARKRSLGAAAWQLRWQMFLLSVTGVSVAFMTLGSVGALREDAAPGAVVSFIVSFVALPLAIGTLVLTPITNAIIATDPSWWQQFLAWSPARNRRRRRRNRLLRDNARRLQRLRATSYRQYLQVSALHDECIEMMTGANDEPNLPSDLVERLMVQTERAAERREKYRQLWRAAIVREHNYELYGREVARVMRVAAKQGADEERAAYEALGVTDVVTGVRAGRRTFVPGTADQGPDDGGFFSADPLDYEVPDVDLDGPWVDDPVEFYPNPSRRLT
jgi:hypothetical protein